MRSLATTTTTIGPLKRPDPPNPDTIGKNLIEKKTFSKRNVAKRSNLKSIGVRIYFLSGHEPPFVDQAFSGIIRGPEVIRHVLDLVSTLVMWQALNSIQLTCKRSPNSRFLVVEEKERRWAKFTMG